MTTKTQWTSSKTNDGLWSTMQHCLQVRRITERAFAVDKRRGNSDRFQATRFIIGLIRVLTQSSDYGDYDMEEALRGFRQMKSAQEVWS